MNDEQYWMQRLDEFSEYLREDRRVGSSAQDQYRSIVERWIDFALSREHDPSTFDQLLVEELLDRQRDLKDNSRAAYTSNLSVWCRWVDSNEPSAATTRDEAPATDALTLWTHHLEAYLDYQQSQGRKPRTIADRRRKLTKWIEFACSTGRDPSRWDVAAIDKAFDAWGTVDSTAQRDDIRGRIRAWCRWCDERHLVQPLQLAELVAEFRREGYPDDDDPRHKHARSEFERILRSLEDMGFDQREELKSVWSNAKYDYGGAGITARLSRTLKEVADEEWTEMRSQLHALCFGDGDIASRFDRCVAQVKGLGQLVATRLLAIADPERFIPNFVLRSSNSKWPGKLDAVETLDQLGLLGEAARREAHAVVTEHQAIGDRGALVMRANDLLLETLRPHFADDGVVDAWGMSKFLYWLMERYPEDHGVESPVVASTDDELADALADAADELLCDLSFLEDIVELLEDKGQVILYGPPGTGKTYFARRLAWTLTGIQDDEEYEENGPYSLVQFHPAYSYEDFFEGFRPRVEDGQLTYKLTSGPLVRLAQRAEENPQERHVMVIDEINRANLPRVLGELLYLLEYRDEWTQTLYRPDEGFTLPSNLWFIGTMNTADRSIALIDAAMRRRFHFVPFFPNHGPTAGLLHRWMQRNSPEQEWVAGLVDKVNTDLAEQMGGDHSLIGPSHFMKSDLDKDGLRRIWEYNIEPLIEDQLFGRQEVIESFRFGSVWRRYGPEATSSGAQPAEPDDQPPDPADEAGSLAGESEGSAEEGDA